MINLTGAQAGGENLASECGSVSPFPARPFQLVTLLDMLRLHWGLVFGTLVELRRHEQKLKIQCDAGHGNDPLNRRDKSRLNIIATVVFNQSTELELEKPLERKGKIKKLLREKDLMGLRSPQTTYTQAHWELKELGDAVLTELNERLLLLIPLELEGYYEQTELFGPLVAKNFPKANKEITAAGNCYVTPPAIIRPAYFI